jgi:hypothetical protein
MTKARNRSHFDSYEATSLTRCSSNSGRRVGDISRLKFSALARWVCLRSGVPDRRAVVIAF